MTGDILVFCVATCALGWWCLSHVKGHSSHALLRGLDGGHSGDARSVGTQRHINSGSICIRPESTQNYQVVWGVFVSRDYNLIYLPYTWPLHCSNFVPLQWQHLAIKPTWASSTPWFTYWATRRLLLHTSKSHNPLTSKYTHINMPTLRRTTDNHCNSYHYHPRNKPVYDIVEKVPRERKNRLCSMAEVRFWKVERNEK